MNNNRAKLLFEKWKADLVKKDRTHKSVEGNFDELFSALHRSKVPFDDAYELLQSAIKEHYPSKENVKFTYRRIRMAIPGKTEDEFEKSWKDDIDSAAKRVFYSLYPIDGEAPKEEAQYGSMSATEYRRQRAVIDAQPRVDLAKIREERKRLMEEFERMEKEQEGANDE